ncbi:MAG TPA: MgtC/SapB family protein [Anaerolineales bacterium]|nr:MgtC/SapB family protein [Anaerolineales bacterium]
MFIFTMEDLVKILIAVLIGGVIGFEREMHSKAAGLRTITLITVGAAMFTILSSKFTDPATSRVASNILTGVGFLGAGAILFAEGKLKGLTTAASIWVAASLGMAVGLGQYILSVATTLLVVIVLDLFTRLDRWLDRKGRESVTYDIVYTDRPGKDKELEEIFRSYRMVIRTHRPMRQNSYRRDIWEIDGRANDHHTLAEKLLEDKEIIELRY